MVGLALLAGCGTTGPSPKSGASLLPGPSQSQPASLGPTPSRPAGDANLPPECFLTATEVEAASGRTLTRPPEGSTGPKGDYSCQYYFGGAPPGGFGCSCLATNGPLDLQGEETAWLDTLPPGGEAVTGAGDQAYLLNESTGNDFWAVKGRTVIHIGISFQFLTAEQFTTLANAAFARIDAGAG